MSNFETIQKLVALVFMLFSYSTYLYDYFHFHAIQKGEDKKYFPLYFIEIVLAFIVSFTYMIPTSAATAMNIVMFKVIAAPLMATVSYLIGTHISELKYSLKKHPDEERKEKLENLNPSFRALLLTSVKPILIFALALLYFII